MTSFNKSSSLFPSKEKMTFLAHCSISPLYRPATEKAIELLREQQRNGATTFGRYYFQQLDELRAQAARLLRTHPDNMATVKNTSEAMSMIANGYPFAPGDEIISYVNEYPANHYPWRLQEKRGVKLKLLPNIPAREGINPDLAGIWSMEDLEKQVTPKTRMIAISHVQFANGYAADLKQLGQFCKERDIDLVVDVAQSLGGMPVYPEEYNIAALASAGWKWLLGPFGIGLFYTSSAFREKIDLVQVGAETMIQNMDYLDHRWRPHSSAKRFEYSSSPITYVAALANCIQEIHAHYGADAIFREIMRLQNVFLKELENPLFQTLLFEPNHRSGILSVYCKELEAFEKVLEEKNIVCAIRAGFIRVAPHFYNTEEDMKLLARTMNEFEA